MITPIVRTKGGAFSLLFDVTEEELEVATVLRDLHIYVEAEARGRGVLLKPTTETSSSPWGAKRIRTSVKKPSSQSPSTVPTPPPSVPSTSGGTGVRDEETNSSFPLSSSRYPPPTQSVPYTSGPPTVPLSQSSPSPQTQAVPSTSGRPSVRVEARTTSFPRNGANDLNHNRLNKTAPVRKKKKKTKGELLETVENLTKSNEFLVLEIEKRKLELKRKAAINEFLKAKKQNLSSAIDGSKTSPEPSTVPQLGILKLLASETEKRKLELEKKAAINELLKENRQNLRSTIEGSKAPPEKTTVPHVGIRKLYLDIRNGHDQRHEHVMGHQEPNESNPITVIAGPETPWHSSEGDETMVLAASIRAIANQKPSLSEVLWNRKDSTSVQAASGEAGHDRMVTKKEGMNKNGSLVTKKEEKNKNGSLVTKKEEMNKNGSLVTKEEMNMNGSLVTKKEDMNKNGSLVTKKEEMNKNGSLVTKKEDMNKNGSLVTKKKEMNKNGSLVTKKEGMNKNGSLVTKKQEMNKNGSLVTKKQEMNKNGSLLTKKEEMNQNGSLVTKKEEMNKNGSLVTKKEEMNKNGSRFVNFLTKGCL